MTTDDGTTVDGTPDACLTVGMLYDFQYGGFPNPPTEDG